jgi:mannose-6-phosphate isomerase-like protein (cupin superfamily)
MFLIHESDVEPSELEGRTTFLLVSRSSGSRTLTHNVSYFQPGHAPGHVHDPEEEVFYVDEGEGEVWIDGVPFGLEPGTAVHTPTKVEHNVHVTGDVPMRIIGSFSPHVVPGSYPNLPARSYDLLEPPSTEAEFVVRVNPTEPIDPSGHHDCPHDPAATGARCRRGLAAQGWRSRPDRACAGRAGHDRGWGCGLSAPARFGRRPHGN